MLPRKPDSFPGRIFHDWPAKLLSLAAALLLFFFSNLNRLGERYLSLPLVISLNDEFVPANQFPRSIKVILRGEQASLVAVGEDDLSASLDLSPLRTEGLHRVNVRIDRKGQAATIDPLEIQADPAEITVSIERRTRKTVPVTPTFRGFLEPGYELASYSIEPQEVEIVGPAGAVARTTDISTDFIELGGRNGDFAIKVNLLRKDGLVSLSGPDTAEFRASVQRALLFRTLSGLDIVVANLDPALAPGESLPGGSMRIHSIRAPGEGQAVTVQGTLTVDATDIAKPGVYTLPVRAQVTEGFVVDSYTPSTVTLDLRPAREVQR